MATDYYVNVNGKKVLASSLSSKLQAKLADSGIAKSEADRQQIQTYNPVREYYTRDHVAVQNNKVVSVPGRYAEKFGIEKPKAKPKPKKLSRRQKLKKKYEEDFYVNLSGKGETKFDALTYSQKINVLDKVNPLELAKQGILAPSTNLAFKTRTVKKVKGEKIISYSHSPVLEKSFKNYLFTGDVKNINKYLNEIMSTKGAREAFKEREMFIAMGVKGTELEGARQGAGKGTRKQRIQKEAQDRRSRQILVKGQKRLSQQRYGSLIIGTKGATFDQRFPTTLIPLEGHKDFIGAVQRKNLTQTWTVEGKEFATKKEAEKYAETQTRVIPMFLLPTPTSFEQTTSKKSELIKGIESAYGFLEKKSQDPNIKHDSEGSGLAVELGKTGLQFASGLLNLASQMDTDFGGSVSKLTGKKYTDKPPTLISFPSSTADAIPFNALLDKGFTKEAGIQIVSESQSYIDKYGFKPFVTGSAINLIGGGAIVKGGINLTTKVSSKIISKIPLSLKSNINPAVISKSTKIYPEIRSQVPLTAGQIKGANLIMKRIMSSESLTGKFSQPSILSKLTPASFGTSQKNVRLVITKPTPTVKFDPSYKPRGRNEGGFKNIYEQDIKQTRISLGRGTVIKPVRIVKPDFQRALPQFRAFMKSTEKSFGQTRIKLGTSQTKKIQKIRPTDYNLGSQQFQDFMKFTGTTKRKYTNIVGSIKLSKGFIPNKYPSISYKGKITKTVESDPFFKNVMPMKRLGGTGKKAKTIKRKSDIDNLLGTGVRETGTVVKLGSSIVISTKTLAKQRADNILKKIGSSGAKRGTTKKRFSNDVPKGYKAVGSGTSQTLVKLESPTKQVIKTTAITKQQQISKQLTQKKRKTPVGIVWAKESKAVTPKAKSKPPILLLSTSQKKKKKQELTSSSISISMKSMLLSKSRLQSKSRSKYLTKIRSLQGTKPKLKSSVKQTPKLKTVLTPKLKFKQTPKLVTKFKPLQTPKLKTTPKQTPKIKQRVTPRFSPPTRPKITPILTPKITPTVVPKITTTAPPKTPPRLIPVAGFTLKPKPRKQPRKKKKYSQDDFFGSTHEGSVFGFRSKTADITYGVKNVAKIVRKERRLERKRRSNVGSRGKIRKVKSPTSETLSLMGSSKKVKLM